jgi:hypothetical protein
VGEARSRPGPSVGWNLMYDQCDLGGTSIMQMWFSGTLLRRFFTIQSPVACGNGSRSIQQLVRAEEGDKNNLPPKEKM